MRWCDHNNVRYILRLKRNPVLECLAEPLSLLVDDLVRRVGLSGTELEHAEVRTIRLQLFKIGAWVQKTVRRIAVKMASSYVWIELFERVVERLTIGRRQENRFG